MGEHTAIGWCDHTFNPWRGCTRVSPGCDHCYAEAWSKRNPRALGTWGDDGERVIAADAYWRTPLRWDRLAAEAGVRRRVFCASLADVFEDRPELVAPRRRLVHLIQQTSNLDWLLLTKRPENARFMLLDHIAAFEWPLPNVWLGVTAEDQERADERIPILLHTPAAVRFVSYEPALGPVDFRMGSADYAGYRSPPAFGGLDAAIDWLIVGGESGPHARPFDIQWARDTITQFRAAGVPVFVKQLGAKPRVYDLSDYPAQEPSMASLDLEHRAGADPSEWPDDVRVQEFPLGGGE